MPATRTSDDSLNKNLWAGIGFALQAYAGATHAMLQLAATVAGSQLVQFPLRDGTLGAQVKAVRAMVDRLNTNYWIEHPRVDAAEQETALRLLRSMDVLVRYRNRVAHDIWRPFAEKEVQDAIEGRPATRWSPVTVHSSIPTLNTLGFLFADAAAGFSRVEMTIARIRAGKEGPGVLEQPAAESADKLDAALRAISAGTLPRWRWIEVRHAYRVTEQQVLEQFQQQIFGEGPQPQTGD